MKKIRKFWKTFIEYFYALFCSTSSTNFNSEMNLHAFDIKVRNWHTKLSERKIAFLPSDIRLKRSSSFSKYILKLVLYLMPSNMCRYHQLIFRAKTESKILTQNLLFSIKVYKNILVIQRKNG